MRLIDADRLVKCFCAHCTSMGEDGVCNEGGECFDKKIIDYTPTVEAEPVRRGKWIEYPECLAYDGAFGDDHIVCSECHHVWSILDNDAETFNYCPNCGARMESEVE